jgi:hypothetical protein
VARDHDRYHSSTRHRHSSSMTENQTFMKKCLLENHSTSRRSRAGTRSALCLQAGINNFSTPDSEGAISGSTKANLNTPLLSKSHRETNVDECEDSGERDCGSSGGDNVAAGTFRTAAAFSSGGGHPEGWHRLKAAGEWNR